MVLDVKGMKSEDGSNDPADKYRLPESRPTRTPHKIAALLAGVGAYVVALFSSRAEAEPARMPPDGEHSPSPVADLVPAPRVQPVRDGPFWSLGDEWEALLSSGRKMTVEDAPRPFLVFTVLDVKAAPPYALTLAEPLPTMAANDARVVLPLITGGGPGALSAPTPALEPPAAPAPERPAPGPEAEPPAGGGDTGGGDADPADRNRAPQNGGPVRLSDLSGCGVLFISSSDLLARTTDPDGDNLVVHELTASSGMIRINANGYVFDPGQGGARSVTLTYLVSDGELSVAQTAHFDVTAGATITGTERDDLLVGTPCSDEIHGGGGNDNIVGRGGSDTILGGAGHDHIVAGSGNDTIFGGAGDDIILGGAGHDLIWGGAGDDRLYGGAGNDTIFGEAGNDFLDGGAGEDMLLGGDGDDVIRDGAGRDIVRGGRGNDRIVAAADGDNDTLDGGAGHDILDYSAAVESVRIDLVGGTAAGADVGLDTISGFEEVIGGSGGDHFVVGGAPLILHGNGGANTFEFVSPAAETGAGSSAGHEIRDFRTGDTIRLVEVDMFRKALDDFEDMFEQIYGLDDDQMMIRVRHDQFEDVRQTIIEADLNRDSHFETVIFVHGLHAFMITDYAA